MEYYAIICSPENGARSFFATNGECAPYLSSIREKADEFAAGLRAHGIKCRVRRVVANITLASSGGNNPRR